MCNRGWRLLKAVGATLLGGAVLAGCAGGEPAPAEPAVPLFEGTGPHHRPITTASGEAQRYFDQGLAFLYGFNHDEAIRSFARAAELDPTCAMAHWGVAYANGPHINNPEVPEDRARAAWEALGRAREHAPAGTEIELALIGALGARYAMPRPDDRMPLDSAYADAMGEVWSAHPEDADVGALYAEALMGEHPWDLWDRDGSPRRWTGEIVEVLESVLEIDPGHPLALHLYIHAVEASPEPGKADDVADRLRDLMPGVGHMVHMPSHIDVLRGRWEEAITANTKAMAADHSYEEQSPRQDFYRLYMAHNHHMRAFAAMMIGRSELALATMREMVAEMPEDWLEQNATWADGWVAMPIEVLMRFGRWEEILVEPEPPEYLPLSRALRHYARGVAYAAMGDVENARAEQALFEEARTLVPEDAFFGTNAAADLLGVAEALLDGEILYRAGEEEAGFARLREAVQREDALHYDEPPDWIQPVRHPLGAALLQSGKYAEAEEVFRADLAKWPGNGWSLFGLGRALRLQGRDADAAEVEAEFERAWMNADVKLTSPCFCQSGV
jgi:tetratricopeptide (TPR) repeat protein